MAWWTLLLSVAAAGDTAASLTYARLTRYPELASALFGDGVTGGDIDGDGYSDVVTSSSDQISVTYGSPRGPDNTRRQSVESLGARRVATTDLDGDGFSDILTSSASGALGLYSYRGGPAGVDVGSEALVRPMDQGGDGFVDFGYSIAPGDIDGDGAPEVLVGAPWWFPKGQDYSEADYVGAAFLYRSNLGALDACTETRIDPPLYGYGQTPFWLGADASLQADTNGDGYLDVTIGCVVCDPNCTNCGSVVVWPGGPVDDFSPEAADLVVFDEEPAGDNHITYFGYNVDAAGDVDADGYDDVVLGTVNGLVLQYGSPTGLSADDRQILPDMGVVTAGVGDLDGDGFDDVVGQQISMQDPVTLALYATIFLGGPSGLDETNVIRTPDAHTLWGVDAVEGVGDVNGDGHPDLAVASRLEAGDRGAVYVFTTVCTRYRDNDADGYGDPDVTLADCHDQPGYAPRPDDCDDTDAAVHGAFWYPDADGDGYGLHDGGAMACARPAHVASVPFDCDDTDAWRNPEATDETIDGIDQNCDLHDGAWTQDTGDCSGDTGEPQDSGGVLDTSDTAAADDTANRSPEATHDCGCAAASGAGGRGALGGALVLVTGVLQRRRSRRTARR